MSAHSQVQLVLPGHMETPGKAELWTPEAPGSTRDMSHSAVGEPTVLLPVCVQPAALLPHHSEPA